MKFLSLALAFGLALPAAAHAAAPAPTPKAMECCCKNMGGAKKMSCCDGMKADAKPKGGADPHAGHDMGKM